jgi:uncharacterized protein (TIGR02265 family)
MAESPLEDDEDWEAVLPLIGRGHRIRGMFISPIADVLDSASLKAVIATLDEPPRAGVFVPFLSYSRRDYLRIVLAAAALGPPALSRAERIRHIAFNDFATFSASLLGQAVRASVGTARAALLRTPQVYSTVAPADDGSVCGGSVGDDVELVFTGYPIFWPYHLGQIEGMVATFGERCSTRVERTPSEVRYLVRLRPGP